MKLKPFSSINRITSLLQSTCIRAWVAKRIWAPRFWSALIAGFGILIQLDRADAALIHRWSFNEGSGTNLIDSVGSANGAIFVAGAGVDYSRGPGYVRLAGGG